MYSYTSPDPIGIVLAWLPIALALFAALLAISISSLTLLFDTLARRYGRQAAATAEPEPA